MYAVFQLLVDEIHGTGWLGPSSLLEGIRSFFLHVSSLALSSFCTNLHTS